VARESSDRNLIQISSLRQIRLKFDSNLIQSTGRAPDLAAKANARGWLPSNKRDISGTSLHPQSRSLSMMIALQAFLLLVPGFAIPDLLA
jgi:hypothetical protein